MTTVNIDGTEYIIIKKADYDKLKDSTYAAARRYIDRQPDGSQKRSTIVAKRSTDTKK